MHDIVIETSRLLLRKFLMKDALSMFELNADPQVVQFTGDTAFASLEEAEALIANYNAYEKYGYGRWTVLLKESNEYIGWCGLKFNEDIQETDLGFRLMRKFWRKGYATEASLACLQYGFDHVNLTKIIGRAMVENTASINVLKKIGMKFEKEFESHGGKCVQYFIAK